MEQDINNFMNYLQEVKHSSKNTLQAYQNDLRKLQLFLQKQNVLSVIKINETNLTSYVLMLEKEGLSPSSVSQNIAAIRAFMLYLLRHGVITYDPSDRIRPPKVKKKPPQVLSEALVDKLLEQPDRKTKKGIRDRAILELLYATGIKVSELIAMKVSDINMSARYITCGDPRERNIPFGKSAKTALQEYMKVRTDSFVKEENEILFLNSSGEQLSRQGLWKILKYYAGKAGSLSVNPNIIRHSFAAHLIENGADVGSVQEFLGHADITTTQLYLNQGYKNSREVYMDTHPRA